ncbi:uncharacterized protein LOC114881767 isoform X1 [Osmia bicornis bicornis]|uniref:uncharacterized protein LOC114881767 isoform X1 n=2 Tax=Osmia bicornis bicornis TaxID=1437191 RepID=UPI0010F65B60|nr:uncharacterized protein LOC114881767 isoform X1 [Osmia bicornis bicornis]XP_029054471.1 uncharacterized protein LOC114881767 isoform X1 [Osmia bicornis bicornis]XP_029054478.1 uncharacterized protein LOC114881767 isoform X1 [Osmia bicornis bicornis]XP_029054479.1 uncharacterized protein LOC114881767 isoform X1 [Osmia bicornis bicornis]
MMLHRSTSSRRSRASRNMTNLSYTSTIAGPRGRRASVATDRPIDLPQTSPRGTMERSPRGSFVPDIALDTENDYESTTHRTLPDRDQYGSRNMLNQKISRSPRNSLVPDDYYRGPRNGGRSPRNSLVPDQGLAPDMLYGSRHSLVPEAPLSPRNSLVPDITHNRSPRNSIAPLTGSRTSLLSENGNQIPSRSPRHSLVPSSSRSPRGSITNMELVDRSPQRSPRGSIASECMNQSPRNSIAPYEQVHRSSRGSIGMNDVHRGSISANEDETRSPRRSINPDIIDRTPRGSFDGLPERRTTKATLMTQDPRRASADQGMNGSKNSSPCRLKEINSGSVKSGGSTVHINLGCGPSTFEDSRRASSSVSQFSNDESRRLFTNGPSVPKSTKENGNVRVVTYGSVVFQLKDANLEADNTCDFVLRALKVVSRTRVATGCLVCLSAVPVSMLIFGWKFFNECPREPRIPIYMVIGGTFGSMFMTLSIYSQIRSRRPEVVMAQPQEPQISFTKLITVVLSFFLLGWFVMGNFWILSIEWPKNESTYYAPNTHCKNRLYIFALVHLIVIYVVFAITFLVIIVLASFRILDCPLPERYK